MQFNEEQLKNKDFLDKIKSQADDLMFYDEVNEAYHLAKDLEASLEKIKDFKEKYFNFYGEYKKMIYRLKWVGLPIMTENMAVEMFKYHFTVTFHIPGFNFNELWRKLKAILLSIIIFKDRDEFKKNLRDALFYNQEKLTGKNLIINNQEKTPSVSNWLLDYNSNLGSGVVENIKRVQYFTNNKNIKNLNEEEKAKVKILFDLYEKLKLSSLTLEGLEEDIPVDDPGREGIIRSGIFEPFEEEKIVYQPVINKATIKVNKSESEREINLQELKNLAAQYPAGSFERKAVEEEIRKLNTK